MITIYKTTKGTGKRPILSLPQSDAEESLATIKRLAQRMGWKYSVRNQAVTIKFKKGEVSATYSVENTYLCEDGRP